MHNEAPLSLVDPYVASFMSTVFFGFPTLGGKTPETQLHFRWGIRVNTKVVAIEFFMFDLSVTDR
jgi:hypothetical protein